MHFNSQIEVEEMLKKPEEFSVFDVRTSSEYEEGRIPGSINIPLFDEGEREEIGIIYARNSLAAKYAAMDIIGPKISRIVRRINGKRLGKTPVIVCWRGGMRSRVVVEFLNMVGIEALQLHGGYRRYRQHVHQQLTNYSLSSKVIVLKGKSGTGKTEILELLLSWGYPVLNLEQLAAHRGSTFGTHEEEKPATQKNFDAYLLMELQRLNESKVILVEGESKRIGNIYLPEFLFSAMKTAPIVEVEGSLESRVERIVRDYTPGSLQSRISKYRALYRLRHKLSKASLAEMKHCLDQEDYAGFVTLILTKHYDNIYDYQLPGSSVLDRVNSDQVERAAEKIAALADSFNCDAD